MEDNKLSEKQKIILITVCVAALLILTAVLIEAYSKAQTNRAKKILDEQTTRILEQIPKIYAP